MFSWAKKLLAILPGRESDQDPLTEPKSDQEKNLNQDAQQTPEKEEEPSCSQQDSDSPKKTPNFAKKLSHFRANSRERRTPDKSYRSRSKSAEPRGERKPCKDDCNQSFDILPSSGAERTPNSHTKWYLPPETGLTARNDDSPEKPTNAEHASLGGQSTPDKYYTPKSSCSTSMKSSNPELSAPSGKQSISEKLYGEMIKGFDRIGNAKTKVFERVAKEVDRMDYSLDRTARDKQENKERNVGRNQNGGNSSKQSDSSNEVKKEASKDSDTMLLGCKLSDNVSSQHSSIAQDQANSKLSGTSAEPLIDICMGDQAKVSELENNVKRANAKEQKGILSSSPSNVIGLKGFSNLSLKFKPSVSQSKSSSTDSITVSDKPPICLTGGAINSLKFIDDQCSNSEEELSQSSASHKTPNDGSVNSTGSLVAPSLVQRIAKEASSHNRSSPFTGFPGSTIKLQSGQLHYKPSPELNILSAQTGSVTGNSKEVSSSGDIVQSSLPVTRSGSIEHSSANTIHNTVASPSSQVLTKLSGDTVIPLSDVTTSATSSNNEMSHLPSSCPPSSSPLKHYSSATVPSFPSSDITHKDAVKLSSPTDSPKELNVKLLPSQNHLLENAGQSSPPANNSFNDSVHSASAPHDTLDNTVQSSSPVSQTDSTKNKTHSSVSSTKNILKEVTHSSQICNSAEEVNESLTSPQNNLHHVVKPSSPSSCKPNQLPPQNNPLEVLSCPTPSTGASKETQGMPTEKTIVASPTNIQSKLPKEEPRSLSISVQGNTPGDVALSSSLGNSPKGSQASQAISHSDSNKSSKEIAQSSPVPLPRTSLKEGTHSVPLSHLTNSVCEIGQSPITPSANNVPKDIVETSSAPSDGPPKDIIIQLPVLSQENSAEDINDISLSSVIPLTDLIQPLPASEDTSQLPPTISSSVQLNDLSQTLPTASLSSVQTQLITRPGPLDEVVHASPSTHTSSSENEIQSSKDANKKPLLTSVCNPSKDLGQKPLSTCTGNAPTDVVQPSSCPEYNPPEELVIFLDNLSNEFARSVQTIVSPDVNQSSSQLTSPDMPSTNINESPPVYSAKDPQHSMKDIRAKPTPGNTAQDLVPSPSLNPTHDTPTQMVVQSPESLGTLSGDVIHPSAQLTSPDKTCGDTISSQGPQSDHVQKELGSNNVPQSAHSNTASEALAKSLPVSSIPSESTVEQPSTPSSPSTNTGHNQVLSKADVDVTVKPLLQLPLAQLECSTRCNEKVTVSSSVPTTNACDTDKIIVQPHPVSLSDSSVVIQTPPPKDAIQQSFPQENVAQSPTLFKNNSPVATVKAAPQTTDCHPQKIMDAECILSDDKVKQEKQDTPGKGKLDDIPTPNVLDTLTDDKALKESVSACPEDKLQNREGSGSRVVCRAEMPLPGDTGTAGIKADSSAKESQLEKACTESLEKKDIKFHNSSPMASVPQKDTLVNDETSLKKGSYSVQNITAESKHLQKSSQKDQVTNNQYKKEEKLSVSSSMGNSQNEQHEPVTLHADENSLKRDISVTKKTNTKCERDSLGKSYNVQRFSLSDQKTLQNKKEEILELIKDEHVNTSDSSHGVAVTDEITVRKDEHIEHSLDNAGDLTKEKRSHSISKTSAGNLSFSSTHKDCHKTKAGTTQEETIKKTNSTTSLNACNTVSSSETENSLQASPLVPRRKKKSHGNSTQSLNLTNDASGREASVEKDLKGYHRPPPRPPKPLSYSKGDFVPVTNESLKGSSSQSKDTSVKQHISTNAAQISCTMPKKPTEASLNPFDSDDDEDTEPTLQTASPIKKVSLNPFDSDDDNDDGGEHKPVVQTNSDSKRQLPPTGYNPFEDDDDEEANDKLPDLNQRVDSSQKLPIHNPLPHRKDENFLSRYSQPNKTVSTNPFDEEEEEENAISSSAPLSREVIKQGFQSLRSYSPFEREDSSFTSGSVQLPSSRKKRRAPLPPGFKLPDSSVPASLFQRQTMHPLSGSSTSLNETFWRREPMNTGSTLSLFSGKKKPPPRPPPPKVRYNQ